MSEPEIVARLCVTSIGFVIVGAAFLDARIYWVGATLALIGCVGIYNTVILYRKLKAEEKSQ